MGNIVVIVTRTVERAGNRLLPTRHFRRVTMRESKRLRDRLSKQK